MFFISLAYILDYSFNNKYIVEFTRFFNSTSIEKESRKDIFSPEINKKISFKFNIRNQILDPIEEKEIESEFEIFFNEVPRKQNEFIETKYQILI
jgi:hypothetical protein